MKDLTQSKTKSLYHPTVHLYKEDINKILETLSEVSNNEVHISDADFEYDSIDEVRQQRGTRLKNLSF